MGKLRIEECNTGSCKLTGLAVNLLLALWFTPMANTSSGDSH